MSRIIFITGTDTGVGKTVLTCLLLQHLRESGVKALAMKPFCSGSNEDLEAIQRIQGQNIEPKLLNPYYFAAPLAPAVAAEQTGRKVVMREAVSAIKRAANQCECLLVEGAGGLLVPITRRRTIAELISALECEVIIVSRNRLGTINHTLLTLESPRLRVSRRPKIVFFEERHPDPSSQQNVGWIKKLAGNIEVFTLPWLQGAGGNITSKKADARISKKTLARICAPDTFSPRCSARWKQAAKRKTEKRKIKR